MTKIEAHSLLLRTLRDCAPRRKELPTQKWIEYERNQMFEETNRLRLELKKDPLGLVQIRRVESLAEGHSDYAWKFALYCAELVVDQP